MVFWNFQSNSDQLFFVIHFLGLGTDYVHLRSLSENIKTNSYSVIVALVIVVLDSNKFSLCLLDAIVFRHSST